MEQEQSSWQMYLKKRFHHPFMTKRGRTFDLIEPLYFKKRNVDHPYYLAYKCLATYFRWGYQDNPDMRERYDRIPSEKGIPEGLWKELKTEFERLPHHTVVVLDEELGDIVYFEILARELMERAEVPFEKAAMMMKEAGMYEAADEVGMGHLNETGTRYYADSILQMMK